MMKKVIYEMNTQNSTDLREAIAFGLRCYILPFIIVIGTILNLLSFFVMKRIRSTTSYYMSILGLTDTGVLLTGGLNLWLLNAFNWTVFLSSTATCKIFPFILYTLLDLSVAIIVIMTGERFFAVSRPLQVNQLFNKRKSTIIILIAFLFCAFINSHFLYTHSIIDYRYEIVQNIYDTVNENLNVNNHNDTYYDLDTSSNIEQFINSTFDHEDPPMYICRYDKWKTFYKRYWPYIDATIYSFLPFILLTIFNTSIVRYLIKAASDSSKLKLYQKPLIGTFVTFQKRNSNSTPNSGSSNKKSSDFSENQVQIGGYASTHVKSVQVHTSSILQKKKSSSVDKLNKMKKKYTVVDYNDRTPLRYQKHPKTLKQSYKGINKRLTIMLFLINVSFCVLSMPIIILQIIHFYKEHEREENEKVALNVYFDQFISLDSNSTSTTSSFANQNEKDNIKTLNLFVAIGELLQYLNHSTNFFLYSFSGKTFRKETKQCLLYYLGLFKEFKKRLKFKLSYKS